MLAQWTVPRVKESGPTVLGRCAVLHLMLCVEIVTPIFTKQDPRGLLVKHALEVAQSVKGSHHRVHPQLGISIVIFALREKRTHLQLVATVLTATKPALRARGMDPTRVA